MMTLCENAGAPTLKSFTYHPIIMTYTVYRKITELVKIVMDEVSWFGTIHMSEDGVSIIIDDIYVPKQEVSGASVHFTPDDQAVFYQVILNLPTGMDIVNRMKFWGHSHVNMGVGPSTIDETQMTSFSEDNTDGEFPFILMGIFNKRGEARFDIHYFDTGIHIQNLPWKVVVNVKDTIADQIQAIVTEKVTKKVYSYSAHDYRKRYDYDDDDYWDKWERGRSGSVISPSPIISKKERKALKEERRLLKRLHPDLFTDSDADDD
jgi:hypothetical protein